MTTEEVAREIRAHTDGPHPCHGRNYTCGKPATQRFYNARTVTMEGEHLVSDYRHVGLQRVLGGVYRVSGRKRCPVPASICLSDQVACHGAHGICHGMRSVGSCERVHIIRHWR